ncbi:MAG: hypothetical protein ACJ75R_04995 [Solirubrobacterales bacterium]
MRRSLVLVVLALTAVAVAPAAAPARSGGFAKCGKVPDQGQKSKVRAANVRCERARKLAENFIAADRVPEGFKTSNPAGCEWFMFKRADKHEFADWMEHGGRIDFKLIAFTKFRGCVS